jgi:uncharacterized protein DUF3147
MVKGARMDILVRFLIGGVVVSVFAMLGDLFSPKSFAGLFGAAPSIALATLGLTITHSGKAYAAMEARSMALAVAGFWIYALLCSRVLLRHRRSALLVTVALLPVWFAMSFGLLWLLSGTAA